jgi:hypothetical protein
MANERPFLIRNWETGAEYEIATLEKFEKVYGNDPNWYIATGKNRVENRQLGERAAEEAAGGGEQVPSADVADDNVLLDDDEPMNDNVDADTFVEDPDGEPVHPPVTPFMSNEIEGESRDV